MINTLFINSIDLPLNNPQDEYTNQTIIDDMGYNAFSRSVLLFSAFMLISVSFYTSCYRSCLNSNRRSDESESLENYLMTYQNEGDTDDCSICLSPLNESRSVILPCSHKYHYQCIIGWFDKEVNCPLCRCDIDI